MNSVAGLIRRGELWLAADSAEVGVLGATPQANVPVASVPFNLAQIDSYLPARGLSRGAIHQWSLAGHPPEFVPCALLALLARNSIADNGAAPTADHGGQTQFNKYLLWIGRQCWPTPFLLNQLMKFKIFDTRGLLKERSLLAHCLFIDPPTTQLKIWAIETALASPAVATVIAHGDCYAKRLTARRFALAAKRGGTLGLFSVSGKNPAATAPSAACSFLSRWSIAPLLSPTPFPRWQLTLLRYRGRALQNRWEVELGSAEFRYDLQTILQSGVTNAESISLRIPSSVVSRTDFAEGTETQAVG